MPKARKTKVETTWSVEETGKNHWSLKSVVNHGDGKASVFSSAGWLITGGKKQEKR